MFVFIVFPPVCDNDLSSAGSLKLSETSDRLYGVKNALDQRLRVLDP